MRSVHPTRRRGRLFVGHRIHALVVVDDCGDAVDIVSDTDLLAGEWLATDPSRGAIDTASGIIDKSTIGPLVPLVNKQIR